MCLRRAKGQEVVNVGGGPWRKGLELTLCCSLGFPPCSLEKENYDVWAKVVRLNEELERERKKFEALEISLRNVERSREDVEKRNRVLEEEVKEFVKSMEKSKTKTDA